MTKDEFKRIWIPLGEGFVRYAESILKDCSDARDAVQDLYIKLWNSKEYLSEIKSPKAYGCAILRNLCLDRIRSQAPKGIPAYGHTPSEDSQEIMITKEKMSNFDKAVKELPPRQRELITMRFYRQMSISEISESTGLTPLNIRVMISRARKILKDKFNRYYEQ